MKIQGQEITYQDLKHRPELWPVIEARVKELEAVVEQNRVILEALDNENRAT